MSTSLRSALTQLHPTVDSVNNAQICDVVGNKDDTVASDSIVGLLKFAANELILVNNRLHNTNLVYPTLADGVTVMSDIDPWVLGNPMEVIPAGAILTDFDIHFVSLEGASNADVYELVLYSGAPGSLVEIGRMRSAKQTVNSGALSVPIPCPIQPASTRISARVASKVGASHTLTISLAYTPSTL